MPVVAFSRKRFRRPPLHWRDAARDVASPARTRRDLEELVLGLFHEDFASPPECPAATKTRFADF
jgi:hypothetical protein